MSANEDHELIARLYEVNKKSPKLVKCSIQHPPDDPEVDVTTWKMNEFKYYDIPSPFPTLARGLFTRKVNDRFQIVVRGYDKFFNIGEVPWNTVSIARESSLLYVAHLVGTPSRTSVRLPTTAFAFLREPVGPLQSLLGIRQPPSSRFVRTDVPSLDHCIIDIALTPFPFHSPVLQLSCPITICALNIHR